MKKKKLAIIGTVGVPALYGGFETLLENLLDYLSVEYDITVFCEADAYAVKLDIYKDAKLIYLNFKANGFQSIFFDSFSIFKSFHKNDYLLILGVSGTIVLPFIKLFCKAKIITNIDGMEWKRDKWGTFQKIFLKFSERMAVNYSDMVISDNLYIKKHIKDTYKIDSTLIAYGGDHVSVEMNFYLGEKFNLQKANYLFTVCRIEPENNIELLIQAYLDSQLHIPYVIVGNWNASQFGKNLINKYSSNSNLRLIHPIYDQNVLDQLRANCYFYLHGHSAGGTNPSLVEAMFLKLPIIAFGVSYNRATTHDEALYFSDSESLIKILGNLSKVDREVISHKMFEIAKKNYTWRNISMKYLNVLKTL